MTTINVPVISKAKGPKAGTSTSSVSNKSKKSSCKCVKTKCLKLYCECFQKGVLCNPECRCKDCSNTKENGVKLKATKKAYLTRNPNTFVKKPKGASPSCACRSNRCLKKYCDCFKNKSFCSGKCTCVDCLNISMKQMKVMMKQK